MSPLPVSPLPAQAVALVWDWHLHALADVTTALWTSPLPDPDPAPVIAALSAELDVLAQRLCDVRTGHLLCVPDFWVHRWAVRAGALGRQLLALTASQ